MGTERWNVSWQAGAATWGDSPGAPGANHGLRFLNWNYPIGQPSREVDDAIGDVDPIDFGHDSTIDINGPLGDMYMRYEGIERIMAFAVGDDAGSIVSTKYNHVMAPPTDLVGVFGQAVVDRNVGNPAEYPSVKLTGGEIKQQNGRMVFTPSGIASDVSFGALSMAAVTQPHLALIIPFRQLVFRIKDATGAALASGDELKLSDFSFRWDNKETGDFTSGNSAGGPEEPEPDGGSREFMLRVTGYKNVTAWENFLRDSHPLSTAGSPRYKADAIWTGPANGSATRLLKIEWPNLVVMDPQITGEGARARVRPSIEFRCLAASSAPTGMTVTKPYQISVEGSDNAEDAITGVTII